MSDSTNPQEKPVAEANEGHEGGDEGADGVSKNAKKRAEKLAKKEQERAEKEAKKKIEAESKPKKEGKQEEEEILDPQKYFENRSAKINKLKENPAGDQFPFPHKWHIDHIIPKFVEAYEPKCPEKGVFLEEQVAIAGRVNSIREVSKKLIFYDLVAEGAKVQLMVNAKNYESEAEYDEIVSVIRRGDIIGARGHPGRTQPGEFSLRASKLKLLAPCLHMLPMERVGVKDPDVRYRQRYLDLMCNKGIREKFLTRTKVIKFVRRFLDDHGFLEVENRLA